MKSPTLLAGYGYQKEGNELAALNSSKKKKQMTPKQLSNKKGEKKNFAEEGNMIESKSKEKHEKKRTFGSDILTENINLTPAEKKPRLSGPSQKKQFFGKKPFCDGGATFPNQSQQLSGFEKQSWSKDNKKQFGDNKPAWKNKKQQKFNKANKALTMKDIENVLAIHKKRRIQMENCALVVKQGGLDIDGWKKLHPDIVTARATKNNKIVWLNFPSEVARNEAYKTISCNKAKNDQMDIDYCGERSKNVKCEPKDDISSVAVSPKMLKIYGVPHHATMEDLLTIFPKASCIKIKTDFIKNPPIVEVEFFKDNAAHEAFLEADNIKIQGVQIFVFHAFLQRGMNLKKVDDDGLVEQEFTTEHFSKRKKAKELKQKKSKKTIQKTPRLALVKKEENDKDGSKDDSEDGDQKDSHSDDISAVNKIEDFDSSSDEDIKKVEKYSDSVTSDESEDS